MEEKQAEKNRTGSGKKQKDKSRLTVGKIVRRVLMVLGILILVVIAAGGYIGVTKVYPLLKEYHQEMSAMVADSSADTFRLQEPSYVYDVNGDVIAKLAGDEDSSYLVYDEIPEHAIDAFIAIEDRTFWENPGIDVKGIIRVGLNFILTRGEVMHGASTITQQLARNRFLTREVSIERKLKEMMLALDLTKKYTKEQIMEFYINDISFANTYYGLQAASWGYFRKDAEDLSLSQIAYLCAIPNSPTYYNPYNHPENAIKRRDKILADMKEMGYITEQEWQEAVDETITVEKKKSYLNNYETTYAVDCAVRYLMRRDGFEFRYGFRKEDELETYRNYYNEVYAQEKDKLYTGGYSIYTSLDPEKQKILQTAVDEGLSFDDKTDENGVYQLQGAATMLDNRSGHVCAIVGGRSQEISTFTLNRAFQSERQPGSTIKPLVVYTPALENGYRSSSLVRNINVDAAKQKGVSVRDLPGAAMELRQAVWLSRNGVAWQVYDNISPELGMAYLTQMRFDTIVPSDYYHAQALGGFTHGTTTEEMAGAYAALANSGHYREPTCIVRIVDTDGNDLFAEYPDIQVYQESSADMMTDILRGVITNGTASSMGWRGPIEAAGKTGTTNGSKDGWFCGMTPYYTISVWVGYDQPRMLSSLYGSTYPAGIWKNAMKAAVEGMEPASFRRPVSDLGIGTGETPYLAGYPDDREISSGYTAGDFRDDHRLADSVIRIMAQPGALESPEIKADASRVAAGIKSPSMRLRMTDIADHGNPGVSFVPVEESTEESESAEEFGPNLDGATGPGLEAGGGGGPQIIVPGTENAQPVIPETEEKTEPETEGKPEETEPEETEPEETETPEIVIPQPIESVPDQGPGQGPSDVPENTENGPGRTPTIVIPD